MANFFASSSKSNRLLQSLRYTIATADNTEAYANVLDLNATEVYTQQQYIPSSSLPYSGSSQHLEFITASIDGTDVNIAQYYHRVQLTRSDRNLGNNKSQAWLAISGSGYDPSGESTDTQLISNNQLTNWISNKYASSSLAISNAEAPIPGYNVSVRVDGSAVTSGWQFDYKTGVLQFTSEADAPSTTATVLVSGYRYVGKTLSDETFGGEAITAHVTSSDNSSGTINTITIQDFDNNVTATFNAGDLKLIFGTPQEANPQLSQSGFNVDRFNLITDSYGLTGSFELGSQNLTSAKLIDVTSNTTIAGPVTSGTEFKEDITAAGSKTYQLQVTSSNPIGGAETKESVDLVLNLDKINPEAPTTTVATDVFLGTANNQIELGSSGSIAYTGSKNSTDNDWTFISMSMNQTFFPTTSGTQIVSGSLSFTPSDTSNIEISSSAHYDSSTDNSPILNAKITSTIETFTRIKSLRFGAFYTSETSSLESNLTDLSLFLKSGSIYKGTTNPNNTTVSINHPTDQFEYIVYDANESDLSEILVGSFNFITEFENPQTSNGYKFYKTKQFKGTANPITYTLKT
jgi:hypothetical protein